MRIFRIALKLPGRESLRIPGSLATRSVTPGSPPRARRTSSARRMSIRPCSIRRRYEMLCSSSSSSLRRDRNSSSPSPSTSATNRGSSTRSIRRFPPGMATTLIYDFPPRSGQARAPTVYFPEFMFCPVSQQPWKTSVPPRCAVDFPDRPRLPSRSIVTANSPDSYCRNAKRPPEYSDEQITQEARIAGQLLRLPRRRGDGGGEWQLDHLRGQGTREHPLARRDRATHVGQRDRPQLRVVDGATDLAGAPTVLGHQVGPGRRGRVSRVLEAEPGQAALHLPEVVHPSDRLLSRVAALVEVHVRAEQAGLLRDHVVGHLAAPAWHAALDPQQLPGLQWRPRHPVGRQRPQRGLRPLPYQVDPQLAAMGNQPGGRDRKSVV